QNTSILAWLRSPTTPGRRNVTPIIGGRLLDTRDGTGVAAPGAVPAHGRVDVLAAGRGGVPAGATGVSVHLAVVSGNATGWLTAFPSDAPQPPTSSLNFAPGRVVANLVTTAVDRSGRFTVVNNGNAPVDIIADVEGFTSTPGQAQPTFAIAPPTRVL